MCNCHTEIENKLLERIRDSAPPGHENLKVELGGYLFALTNDGGFTHRSASPVTATYMAPKKSGGMKKVTQKTNIRANYCPFCGINYDAAAIGKEINT